MIDKKNLDIRLEVDGGINLENIASVAEAGADTFVAGSAIFNQEDYSKIIKQMRSSLEAL
jgi:ribulose-phosphate 3-epimerase